MATVRKSKTAPQEKTRPSRIHFQARGGKINRQRTHTLMFEMKDNCLHVSWAKPHPNDKMDKVKGVEMATKRLERLMIRTIPEELAMKISSYNKCLPYKVSRTLPHYLGMAARYFKATPGTQMKLYNAGYPDMVGTLGEILDHVAFQKREKKESA